MVLVEKVMRNTHLRWRNQRECVHMTTEDIIIHIFLLGRWPNGRCQKVPQAKLYPSEVVTIGIIFALKGGHFRAFCRWLKRDYRDLFGGLPDRTTLQCQLQTQQDHADQLLGEVSLMNAIDLFPIELLFPIQAGCSPQQFGKKNRYKERWSIGIKLAWVLNRLGQVVSWYWLTMNCPDQDFLPLVDLVQDDGVVLLIWAFVVNKASLIISNCVWKSLGRITWWLKSLFPCSRLLSCQKMFHRTTVHLEAHLAYTAALFNVLISLDRHLHPDHAFKISIADFSSWLALLVVTGKYLSTYLNVIVPKILVDAICQTRWLHQLPLIPADHLSPWLLADDLL